MINVGRGPGKILEVKKYGIHLQSDLNLHRSYKSKKLLKRNEIQISNTCRGIVWDINETIDVMRLIISQIAVSVHKQYNFAYI